MRCSIAGVVLISAALALAVMAQLVLRSAPSAPGRLTQQGATVHGPRTIAAVDQGALMYSSLSPGGGVGGGGAAAGGGGATAAAAPPTAVHHETVGDGAPAAGSAASTCSGGPRFEHLQLNEPARKLWQCSSAVSEASVKAVFLTFGSHSMADFLLNWVAHVKKIDQRLYLVGALDAKLAALCLREGIPAATISDAALEQMGANKLSASAEHTYYRYAPGTFLRMGLIKQVFIREMLTSGLDAMVSDVDVAWLRSPWPLIRYGGPSQPTVQPRCRLLALADVVLSVDQVQQYMDTDKHYWHIGSELNTGVAFFRNSEGALAVLDEWKVAMAKAIAARNPNHDQFWLNEVLQKRDFVNLKLDAAGRAEWLPGALRRLRHADAARVGLPGGADDFNTTDPSLRAIFQFKRKFGIGEPSSKVGVTIGTFPIAEVSNGHTFFVQKLHDIVGVPPVCVHTTYQYGDSPAYAYGKRERLRDAHLWTLDTPSSHWSGKFLRLTTSAARQLGPMTSQLLQPEAIDPDHCVRSHLKLMMLQRQWLMDGFLLAKALGRTLILPPLWCMLDRFWTILNHCLIGSQVEMPQPFVCPLDHSFNIPGMVDAGLEWREHTFLDHPSAPGELVASTVRVEVGDKGNGLSVDGDGSVQVAAGSTLAHAVTTLRAVPSATSARVVSIDAASLGRLCRCLEGLPEVHELAGRLPKLLSNDFHYCDTTDNPYFVECKRHRRQGCRKHKTYLMNVSRGVQRPPPVPTSGCGGDGLAQTCLAYEIPKKHISEGVIGATSV